MNVLKSEVFGIVDIYSVAQKRITKREDCFARTNDPSNKIIKKLIYQTY